MRVFVLAEIDYDEKMVVGQAQGEYGGWEVRNLGAEQLGGPAIANQVLQLGEHSF